MNGVFKRASFVAVLVLALPAHGSWRFEAGTSARLDYGDLPLVTGGPAGAFSCFSSVKLDEPLAGDAFIAGKVVGDDARGWQIVLSRAVEGTMHERRFRFWVSGGAGAETERYAGAEAVPGQWTSVGGSYAWSEGAASRAGDMALYVDGAPDWEPPRFDAGRGPGLHADPFTIGAPAAAAPGGTTLRVGHVAVWDGIALSADEHRLLALGADPRTIAPAHLVFYASLEDAEADDGAAGARPQALDGAAFSVDRRPDFAPLVVASGDVTPDAVRIMSHVGRAGSHRIEYTTTDFPGTLTDPVTAALEDDWVAASTLTGLAPDHVYRFRLRFDDVVIPASESTLRTAPAGDRAVFSFIYASCTQFQNHEPPYDRYGFRALRGAADREPAFIVHSGDVWYADHGGHDEETPFNAWETNSVEGFVRKARESYADKHFAHVLQRTAIFSMPDDHEWTNNLSAVHTLRDEQRERYDKGLARILNWQFKRNPDRLPKALDDGGLWYAFRYGGVDFFFLDVRTQRSANWIENTPEKRMLGPDDRQLQDLLDWLDASTARFKVILSPGMISRFGTTVRDAWGSESGFSADAERVLALIAAHDDVVFLAGDVHWSGAVRLAAHPGGDPAHDLYEFIGSPYAGHLSPPAPGGDEDLLFTYDGAGFDPERMSYLQVTVDSTVTPASMDVRIIAHDPGTGAEQVVYAHPLIRSRRTCPGDADASGRVDTYDLVAVLASWGPCPPGRCPSDVDGSGVVDTLDLVLLLAVWGNCPD